MLSSVKASCLTSEQLPVDSNELVDGDPRDDVEVEDSDDDVMSDVTDDDAFDASVDVSTMSGFLLKLRSRGTSLSAILSRDLWCQISGKQEPLNS